MKNRKILRITQAVILNGVFLVTLLFSNISFENDNTERMALIISKNIALANGSCVYDPYYVCGLGGEPLIDCAPYVSGQEHQYWCGENAQ